MLLIRSRTPDDDAANLPPTLQIDEQVGPAGLPLLRGELATAPAAAVVVLLQVRNSAGIPIIEGHAAVAAGERTVLFADLRPIGIDAYAHKSVAERAHIAERIWTRRAYGTLQLKV